MRRLFACPDCHADLVWGAAHAICEAGHQFEVRKGILIVKSNDEMQTQYFDHMWRSRERADLPPVMRHQLEIFPEALDGLILEIGSGDARLARTYGHLDIISTDLVPAGLAGLGERAAACPATKLPFRDGVFDTVIALEVLEHLPLDELSRAVAEIRRVLRCGGRLLISVPTWPVALLERLLRGIRHGCWPRLDNLERWDYPHRMRYGEKQLVARLDGFQVVGSRRWFRSGAAIGLYGLNPVLRRIGAGTVDTTGLDRLLPGGGGSNLVLLAIRD